MRILLLGGTTDANQMARALAERNVGAIYSYAGRTKTPITQPLPSRIGGFGGVAGLMTYLSDENITHIIDATHPFAAQMSINAFKASIATGLPLLRLERPPWTPYPSDQWTIAAHLEDIPEMLPDDPARVFLAIGKQQIGFFAAKPQHHYLLRLVDPPAGPLPLPNATVVLARGPFDVASDTALLREHRISHIVSKNAGGSGAQAKLEAARTLGLPVILANRPPLPGNTVAQSTAQVMQWLGHVADRGV
jgi:precorrin-6A/cobalt-precorrin-6A reductase